MAIIITCCLNTYIKDEFGNKTFIPLENENSILDNINKYLKRTNRAVLIGNNPNNFDENDARMETAFLSFELSGINFNEKFC